MLARSTVETTLYVGMTSEKQPELFPLKFANRHGLITGATGTGKTVTLQMLAEGFSNAGVSVFATDIKGDLSGIAKEGKPTEFVTRRCAKLGITFAEQAFPTVFWDLFGKQGLPIKTTIDDFGPLLLSRLLNLTQTQEGALNVVFKMVRSNNSVMATLTNLKVMLQYAASKHGEISQQYGYLTPSTIGVLQRQLLVLEQQGGDALFGAQEFDITKLVNTDDTGQGYVHLFAADKLMDSPQVYAAFLTWMLMKLYRTLPEVGDLPQPKLVLLFDEAHLMFADASKTVLTAIERVVRLIRSKGVGVYFVTQNPLDVPNSVSAQLGNRVQHALRAFTPKEQKAVRTVAETFRQNPRLDTETEIMELGKGEALTSFLHGDGTPSMVQRTLIAPPMSQIGPISDAERGIHTDMVRLEYGTVEAAVPMTVPWRPSSYMVTSVIVWSVVILFILYATSK